MELLDATCLADRLQWEAKEYWLHLEADSPFEKYPAKQHARKVQEKLRVEEGLIYLPGQPARNNEDSDMPAPFRQRRYFYYLSGCNEPNCHLTYDLRRDLLCLFIPRINPERVIWNGRGSNRAEALDKYDIDKVYYVDELQGFFHEWLIFEKNRNAEIYALNLPSRPPVAHNFESLINYDILKPAINVSRMIKDDHEIKLIRKANDISSQAHVEVLANILNYKNEAQVEGLFMDVCISQQAKEQAYDPIAASGPNAGTLHYDANNEDFDDRQLMCLDAGCEYKLYASDITRTFPLSASWPSKQAESIYRLVQSMQENCIKQLAPGVRYLDLHIQAHQIAISGLLQLGILYNGSKEEIYKSGTSRAFFPHGLGHHIGLEVHDVGQAELMSVRGGKLVHGQAPSLFPKGYHNPVYDAKTCHAPTDPESSHLEEGMVVTVEPGIYFSVYALQHFYFSSPIHSKYINAEVVKQYLPVGGVRIEDDILITSNGYENLTTAPKGDDMLKIIKSGKSSMRELPYRRPAREKSAVEEMLRTRAPGISANMPKPILRPLARAATMPPEFTQHNSVDFEPMTEASSISKFRRSMTTEEKISHWRHASAHAKRSPTSICGQSNVDVEHTYIGDRYSIVDVSQGELKAEAKKCTNCSILTQTLGRLRQNLPMSKPASPKTTSESTRLQMQSIDPQSSAPHNPSQIPVMKYKSNEDIGKCNIRPSRNDHRRIKQNTYMRICTQCQRNGFICDSDGPSRQCLRCRTLQVDCVFGEYKVAEHNHSSDSLLDTGAGIKDLPLLPMMHSFTRERQASCRNSSASEKPGSNGTPTYHTSCGTTSRNKNGTVAATVLSEQMLERRSEHTSTENLLHARHQRIEVVSVQEKQGATASNMSNPSAQHTLQPLYTSTPPYDIQNSPGASKGKGKGKQLAARPHDYRPDLDATLAPYPGPNAHSQRQSPPDASGPPQSIQHTPFPRFPPLPSGWEFARGQARAALDKARPQTLEDTSRFHAPVPPPHSPLPVLRSKTEQQSAARNIEQEHTKALRAKSAARQPLGVPEDHQLDLRADQGGEVVAEKEVSSAEEYAAHVTRRQGEASAADAEYAAWR